MRRWHLWGVIGLLAVGFAAPCRAALPKDMDELKARHEELGKTPEGATKLWLDACFVYMNEETRKLGREMLTYLTIPFKTDADWEKRPSNRVLVERLTKPEFAHIWRSYAKGTSPDNQYKMDPNDWELNHVRNFQHEGDTRGIQCYIKSSGADTDRPVYLKKSTTSELYYMNLYVNVCPGIRAPKDPNQEEFK